MLEHCSVTLAIANAILPQYLASTLS